MGLTSANQHEEVGEALNVEHRTADHETTTTPYVVLEIGTFTLFLRNPETLLRIAAATATGATELLAAQRARRAELEENAT